MALARCPKCKWNYPEHYLHSMFVNSAHTAPICGICALAISNHVHGINRKRFQGQMADKARLDAIRWRKRNPKQGPEVITTQYPARVE